jgi:hypothetical protein
MTVSPSPGGGEPELRPGLDPEQVTPGTLGFLATLFVVVLTIFLIRDMTKRIRRVRYQAQVEEEELTAASAREAGETGARGAASASAEAGTEASAEAAAEGTEPDDGGRPGAGG